MFRLALVALLVTSACRQSLEDDDGGTSVDGTGGRACNVVASNPTCVMADAMPDVSQKLAWIEQNVFGQNCGSSSCHSPAAGGNPAGRLVLTTGSFDKLVNADATFATGRKLVVPGSIKQSYLMVLMHGISLAEAEPSPAPEPSGGRYMPLGSPAVCCQKIDAIGRWIMAGAMNN
jgi:hypothetical protein